MRNFGFSLTLVLLGLSFGVQANAWGREIPELTGHVIDEWRVLSESEKSDLGTLIRQAQPHAQIQIWLVRELAGEPIESLTIRAVDEWKLGTQKEDNGILLVAAKAEKKMRIEVGQGLEGNIPDAIAGRIVRDILAPRFRVADFYGGLHNAIQLLSQRAGATQGSQQPQSPLESPGPQKIKLLKALAFIVFGILFLIVRFTSGFSGGPFGSRRRSHVWWGGGGGGWGSGGGGGWSGGGGGFSGGGSSGNW